MSPAGGLAFRGTKKPAAAAPPGTELNPSAQSGYIETALSASYSDARAGTTIALVNTGAFPVSGQAFYPATSYDPDLYQCWEAFFDFDTSSLVGTISSAILSLGLHGDSSTTDFVLEARLHDWGTTLTAADWIAGANLGTKTLLATLATSGIGAAGSYKAFTDVAMIANINRSGFTRMVVSSDRQRVGNTPTTYEYCQFKPYNDALKAKLVVVTT